MNIQHSTFNIQRPGRGLAAFHSVFGVGCSVLDVSALILLLVASLLFAFPTRAATVYETPAEFLASGDFNGDGRTDALVLDKLTGNARVGYQNISGALNWFGPFTTGADSASALAVGRFSQTNSEAIAVTAAALNQIRILNFSNPSNVPSAGIVNPNHAGVSMLVGLDAPYGATADRSWLAAGASDPGIMLVDLFGFLGDSLTYFQDQIAAQGYLASGSAFQRFTNDATLLAAIRRGSNDTFLTYAWSNTAAPVLVRSNLPPGTEYVSARFNNEPYPRLLFYTPGESNVIVQPVVFNGTTFDFGAATLNTFTSAVQRVFVVQEQTNGLVVVQFGNGVVGLRPPSGGGGTLTVSYGFGIGLTGNIIKGVVPLGLGKFALLSSSSNSTFSTHAQVFTQNGAGAYVQTSSNTLSAVTTSATRGNVWLFQAEPFTSSAATLIASLNAPVWSSAVMGLPGAVSVRVESDGGTTSGLGSPATNSFGAPPAGTIYALPNQYREDISFFGYAPARPPEPSVVTISPPPGIYSGPISISFTKQNSSDDVFYRVNENNSWQLYFGPFALTNDATVQYYGSTSSGLRARTQLASYSLGRTNPPTVEPVLDLDPSGTNQSPPVLPGTVLSAEGTIFYSRADYSIWAINLDGSGDTRITSGYFPRVSRDGRYLLFLQPANGLWLRNLKTGVETQLDPQYFGITGYDWDRSNTNYVMDKDCYILVRDLLGSSTPLPLGDCGDDAPVVNPVNGSLAYHNLSGNAAINGIYTMPPARNTRTRLNLNLTNPRWPSWSPSAQQLAVAAGKPNVPSESLYNLWLFNSDGSNLRQITALSANDHLDYGAIWAPDERALITAGTIWGTNGLWVLHLGPDGNYCGCAPIRLPTSPGAAIQFAGSIVTSQAAGAAVPVPGLFIRTEPNAVVVYWSTSYNGFVLEYTTDLNAPAVWTQINGPYFLNGGYYEYHEAKASLATKKFFRLRYPGVFFLTPPEAELSFELQSGEAVLTWPDQYVGYTLESTTSLNPPASWSPVAGSYGITNGHFEFRQSLIGTKPREFFRLRWP